MKPAKIAAKPQLAMIVLGAFLMLNALALAWFSWHQQQLLQTRVDQLESRLSAGGQHAQTQEEIAQLTQLLDGLQNQLAVTQTTAPAASQQQRSNPSATAAPTKAAADVPRIPQTSPEFEKLMADGYVNEQNWNQIDARVKAMTKEESRVFWESLQTAIQEGRLPYYMAQQE